MSLRKQLKEDIGVSLKLQFESSQYSGIVYHGNSISVNYETAIDSFKSQFEDFGAVWMTKNEDFAEEFAQKFYKKDSDKSLRVVFKCRLTLDNFVDIDYSTYQDILNSANSDNLKDYIPALKYLGYDGWMTEGDLNEDPYDDIAVFNPDKSIEILSAKAYLENGWSDWISLENLERFIYITKMQNL